jgi:S-adenosylmethionine:tRNA ribosyltransferase-isomerase
MKLSDFWYPIPKKLIAKKPASPRDKAKLMVITRKTGEMEDKKFSNLVDYMKKGDCIVLNETKVFPALLWGRKEKTSAKIQVLLLRQLMAEEGIWDVIVDPARKVRIGNKIYFDDGKLFCEVIDNTTSRGRTVRFNFTGNMYKVIDRIGHMPLPPYIKRDPSEKDKDDYQTVYAKNIGAVAAPTAGLHITKELLAKAKQKGVKVAKVTLHIGLGTFRKVEVEDLTKHKMDSEYYEVDQEAVNIVNETIDSKHKVWVVGTSTVRALESSTTADRHLKASKGWTDKFIYPPYQFKIADHLITNLHMPESTLLILTAAFCGKELIMKAYKKALKDNYRFYSYGDAMCIL